MSASRTTAPEADLSTEGGDSSFALHLDNFEGPFDLLLSLIS